MERPRVFFFLALERLRVAAGHFRLHVRRAGLARVRGTLIIIGSESPVLPRAVGAQISAAQSTTMAGDGLQLVPQAQAQF